MTKAKRYPDKPVKRADSLRLVDIMAALTSAKQRLIELQNATGYPTALPQIEIDHVIRRLKNYKTVKELDI